MYISKIFTKVVGTDDCQTITPQLSAVPTLLDIFYTQQHYVCILVVFNCLFLTDPVKDIEMCYF